MFLSDYAGCNGNNLPWNATFGGPGNGMILSQTAGTSSGGGIVTRNVVRPTDVTDGLAYTLMLAEKAADPAAPTPGITNEDDVSYAAGYNFANLNAIRFTNPTLLPMRDTDFTLVSGKASPSGGAFGSIHPGVFNALMGDGSVLALSYTISPNIYAAIGSIKGHEIVSDVDLYP